MPSGSPCSKHGKVAGWQVIKARLYNMSYYSPGAETHTAGRFFDLGLPEPWAASASAIAEA
jgi:hypothetical protein